MYSAGNPVRTYENVKKWRSGSGSIVITFDNGEREIISSGSWLSISEKK
jgi:hypothetical protein